MFDLFVISHIELLYICVTITTGDVLFAEGPGHSAKAQKPSANALPSAALGKVPSKKNLGSEYFGFRLFRFGSDSNRIFFNRG